jgi:hypothetical protein
MVLTDLLALGLPILPVHTAAAVVAAPVHCFFCLPYIMSTHEILVMTTANLGTNNLQHKDSKLDYQVFPKKHIG